MMINIHMLFDCATKIENLKTVLRSADESPVYTTIFWHGTRLNLAPVPKIFGPAPSIFVV